MLSWSESDVSRGVCFVAYLGYQFVYLLVSCFEYGTFSNGGSMDSCDATHDGSRMGHYLYHKNFKKSRVELAIESIFFLLFFL